MHSSWDITLSDVKGISLPYDKELIVTKGANQKTDPTHWDLGPQVMKKPCKAGLLKSLRLLYRNYEICQIKFYFTSFILID